jgi:hypothetical protein
MMVPGEGFEPPTFGLQNRCTATVLTRPIRTLVSEFDNQRQGRTPLVSGLRDRLFSARRGVSQHLFGVGQRRCRQGRL